MTEPASKTLMSLSGLQTDYDYWVRGYHEKMAENVKMQDRIREQDAEIERLRVVAFEALAVLSGEAMTKSSLVRAVNGLVKALKGRAS